MHGIKVIPLCSEVNKGEVVLASVDASHRKTAHLRESRFRDAGSLLQEFFQTFGATSNGNHCSAPITITNSYSPDRHILGNKIPEHSMQKEQTTNWKAEPQYNMSKHWPEPGSNRAQLILLENKEI